MNLAIIPTLSSMDAKRGFLHDIEAWKNFARRITKNLFVKSFLLERDGVKCSWCKKHLTAAPVIHHHTYEHVCTYNETKRIVTSALRAREVPDCESCRQKDEHRFLTCMDKLSLVHAMCNKAIEDRRKVNSLHS